MALVSPYSDALTRASEGYWRARGFEVGQVARVTAAAGETAAPGAHPIYALGDASLPAIAATPRVGGAPVLPCMLALAWACARHVAGGPEGSGAIERWVGGDDWRHRMFQRLDGPDVLH